MKLKEKQFKCYTGTNILSNGGHCDKCYFKKSGTLLRNCSCTTVHDQWVDVRVMFLIKNTLAGKLDENK